MVVQIYHYVLYIQAWLLVSAGSMVPSYWVKLNVVMSGSELISYVCKAAGIVSNHAFVKSGHFSWGSFNIH